MLDLGSRSPAITVTKASAQASRLQRGRRFFDVMPSDSSRRARGLEPGDAVGVHCAVAEQRLPREGDAQRRGLGAHLVEEGSAGAGAA